MFPMPLPSAPSSCFRVFLVHPLRAHNFVLVTSHSSDAPGHHVRQNLTTGLPLLPCLTYSARGTGFPQDSYPSRMLPMLLVFVHQLFYSWEGEALRRS